MTASKRLFTWEKYGPTIDIVGVDSVAIAKLLGNVAGNYEDINAVRQRNQQIHLRNLVGEFTLQQNLVGNPKGARANAVLKHAQMLGLAELIYVGCDAVNYAQEGRIYGRHSKPQQTKHRDTNETYGIHASGWPTAVHGNVEPLRYATDPEKSRIGMVLGLDSAKLEPTSNLSAGGV